MRKPVHILVKSYSDTKVLGVGNVYASAFNHSLCFKTVIWCSIIDQVFKVLLKEKGQNQGGELGH